MFLDFEGEKLPIRRFILNLTRHKVPGGWYVRIITTERGHGAGGRGENALFLSDPAHSWRIDGFKWEMIKKEPDGGVYRAKAPGGWLVFSTAQGSAKTDDGTKYHPRIGSLVFIPEPTQEWECDILEERDMFS